MSLRAIPPALLLLVLPFALYSLAAHPASSLARLAIAILALVSLLAASLGLAFAATSRLPLFHAATVFAVLLRFIRALLFVTNLPAYTHPRRSFLVGVCVIHLTNVASPRRLSRLQLYNILLVLVLFCGLFRLSSPLQLRPLTSTL